MIVERLSVTPVSGLHLNTVDSLELTRWGASGDRRFYLIDDDGRLMDSVRRPALTAVHSAWDGRVLTLTLPDGTTIADEPRLGEAIAADEKRFRRVPGRIVEGPLGAPLEAFAGRPVRLVKVEGEQSAQACFPVSIIGSASSADLLPEHLGSARFRMLIEFSGAGPYEEDTWLGHRVQIGETVIAVCERSERCVLTTRDPDTGARDFDTLRVLRKRRGSSHMGVYGEVEEPGTVRVGDTIEVLAG